MHQAWTAVVEEVRRTLKGQIFLALHSWKNWELNVWALVHLQLHSAWHLPLLITQVHTFLRTNRQNRKTDRNVSNLLPINTDKWNLNVCTAAHLPPNPQPAKRDREKSLIDHRSCFSTAGDRAQANPDKLPFRRLNIYQHVLQSVYHFTPKKINTSRANARNHMYVCTHAIIHMEEPIRSRGWETCSSRAPALDADTHLHLELTLFPAQRGLSMLPLCSVTEPLTPQSLNVW